MKSKRLLIILLMAVFAPLAMNGQTQNTLLSQNFDGTGFSISDDTYNASAWYAYNAGSGNNWSLNQHSSDAHSGNYDVCYAYSSYYAANCYLVSEPFSVNANMTQLSVSLYEKVLSSSYAETFEVFFVKASDVTTLDAVASATQYSAIASASYTNDSWAEQSNTIANTALAGQSVRLVVHCTSANDQWDLYIDDITVIETVQLGPYITLNPTSATVLTGFTQNLTATYGNVTGTPSITYTTSDATVASVIGNGTTATVTGESAGTATITATMTYEGTDYTAQCVVTIENPSYCTPSSYDSNDDCIVRFVLGDIDNSTASSSTNGYGDYTNLSTSFDPGETATATVYGGAGSGGHAAALWIDFNNNYEFETSERVGTTSGFINPNSTSSGDITFTIPIDAPAGSHRMRVKYEYGTEATNIDPCTANTQYGEAEDYTIVINALGAYTITCNTPTHGTLSADKNNADENVVITIAAVPETNYQLAALTYMPEGGTAQNINIASTPYTFTMPAANVTVNATYSLIRNLPPYALTVGVPLGHSVVLGWTGVSTNTHHQNYEVYYSTTNTAPSDDLSSGYETTNTVPYTLEGLDPNTTYYAWVRDNCDTDGKSSWVAFNSFTTDNACATNTLTVSNLTAHSAHIGWNGETDNYTVKFSTATVTGTTLDPVFEDGFENGIDSWTTYAVGEYTTNTWAQTDAVSFFDGDGTTNHTGSYVAMTRSYYNGDDVSVDNWLVTPQMTLGDVVKFWVCGDDANYQEYYAVYVSTGTNAVSDFAMVAAPELAPGDGTWAERTVDLSAYAGQTGYVAIRHTDYAKDFLLVDDFGVYNTINTYSYGGWTTVSPNPTTTSCQLTGLSAETLYEVQVQANCGSSAWSSVRFTTPDNCGAPQELAASNVTPTTATLSWADDKNSYNLQYRKVYFYEGFEGETLPTGWTTIDANNDGNTWGIGHATTHTGNNGAANISFIYNTTGTTPDDYLVSPQLDLQGTLRVWLSGFTDDSNAEHFEILLSTSGNSVSDFTTTLVAETTTTNSYVEYTADLSSYSGKGYIAIHHFNCSDQRYLYVDDFGIYGSEDWVTLSPNPTTETANLTDLTPGITYEWQVRGLNCNNDGEATDWSAVSTFITETFSSPTWPSNNGPDENEDVVLVHDVIIPNGVVAYANSITLVNGAKLIIEDGGQLVTYTMVEASVEKDINNATNWGNQDLDSPYTPDGWYFIASPLNGASFSTAATGDYDLYMLDWANLQWLNIKNDEHSSLFANGFQLGTGYLYASHSGTTLSLEGEIKPLTEADTAQVVLATDGWNLIGNPLTCKVTVDCAFDKLNDASSVTSCPANSTINPCQGIAVWGDAGTKVTFTKATSQASAAPSNNSLQMTLAQNATTRGNTSSVIIDNAVVSFNEGSELPKFYFGTQNANIYIPQGGKEYAIVSVGGRDGVHTVSTMPVNFKAKRNGQYTLTVNPEYVEMGYLHLIDNLTGNDIDLLQTPSYSFSANVMDYESRFKLVFVANENDNENENEDFAFIGSDGQLIVNGTGTIQIIDLMGRVISTSSTEERLSTNGMTAGVYVLQLITGTETKTQKIVIR